MMRDFLEAIVAVVVIVILAFWTCNFFGSYSCGNYKDITGVDTKWVTLDACYVKTKTGYARWDEYKAKTTASNLKD